MSASRKYQTPENEYQDTVSETIATVVVETVLAEIKTDPYGEQSPLAACFAAIALHVERSDPGDAHQYAFRFTGSDDPFRVSVSVPR